MHQPVDDNDVPAVIVHGYAGGQRCEVRVRFMPIAGCRRYTAAECIDQARALARFHFWLKVAAPLYLPYSLVQVGRVVPQNLPPK